LNDHFDFSAMTNAVRHCIEYRFQRFDTSKTSPPQTKTPFKDPIEYILELTALFNSPHDDNLTENIESLLSSFIKNPESVLQDIDIHRLRAILYRDVVRQDRSKTGKNVVIVVVNPSTIFFFLCFVCFCPALIVYFHLISS
jgi:hypothetical protein